PRGSRSSRRVRIRRKAPRTTGSRGSEPPPLISRISMSPRVPLHRRPGRSIQAGMTVLEIMIVLAILGGGAMLVRSGFRLITKADLVENATELSAVMQRAGQLSIEHGELHRVVFD